MYKIAFDVGAIIAHLKLDASNFQQNLSGASREAEGGGLSMGKLAAGVALGQAAFAAAQAAISGVADTLKSTVSDAEDFGSTVMKLKRDTGLATDQASQLAFAFHSVGIDADTGAAMVVKFDKQIAAANDSTSKSTAELTKLGVATLDVHGKQRTFNDILGDTADAINKMGSQEDKVAETTKLFGKAGEPMLKFLALGKEGMAEVEAEATKYGLVLTDQNVGSVQAFIKSHREMDAAMEGIKIKIGLAVMPALTSVSTFLSNLAASPTMQEWAKKIGDALSSIVSVVGPALKDLSTFVRILFDTISGGDPTLSAGEEKFAKIAEVLSEVGYVINYVLLPAIMEVAKWVGQGLKAAIDLIWPALKQLFDVIAKDLAPALEHLIKELLPILGPLLKITAEVVGAILVVAIWILINALTFTIHVMSDLIQWFANAIQWGKDFAHGIGDAFNWLVGVISNAMSKIYHIIVDPFTNAFNDVMQAFHSISNIGSTLHNLHIPGFATGIQNFAGGMAYVHQGEVLMNLPQGASVVPANQVSQIGGKGGVTLQVQGNLNVGSDYDVDQMMNRIGRNVELQQKGLAPV